MVKIIFSIAGKVIGEMTSSLESFDAAPHLIPKRILNKICNTSNSVEITFQIEQTNNDSMNLPEELRTVYPSPFAEVFKDIEQRFTNKKLTEREKTLMHLYYTKLFGGNKNE